MGIVFSVDVLCDVGCKREHNEDMVLVGEVVFRDGRRSSKLPLLPERAVALAVADGMGGMEKGEEASAFVLAGLEDLLSRLPGDLEEEELGEVFRVFAQETHRGMPVDGGSTLVGLLAYRESLYRFHAGDSRLYLYRNKELTRLTRDHSLREMGGRPEAPSNVIINALGGGGESFIELAKLDYGPRAGDSYLLSSDGLHDLVSEADIRKVLCAGGDTAGRLLAEAKERGGKDNVSIVLARVEEE